MKCATMYVFTLQNRVFDMIRKAGDFCIDNSVCTYNESKQNRINTKASSHDLERSNSSLGLYKVLIEPASHTLTYFKMCSNSMSRLFGAFLLAAAIYESAGCDVNAPLPKDEPTIDPGKVSLWIQPHTLSRCSAIF